MEKVNIKKTTHLFWMVLICILPLLGGCEKEEEMDEDELRCPVTAVDGADDDIIGKWKLVKVQTSGFVSPRTTEDYSCDNVIYHFKEDGILTISGANEGMRTRPNGEYSFEFKDVPFSVYPYTLAIDKLNKACVIEDDKMVLDMAPLDGDTWYFVRVE